MSFQIKTNVLIAAIPSILCLLYSAPSLIKGCIYIKNKLKTIKPSDLVNLGKYISISSLGPSLLCLCSLQPIVFLVFSLVWIFIACSVMAVCLDPKRDKRTNIEHLKENFAKDEVSYKFEYTCEPTKSTELDKFVDALEAGPAWSGPYGQEQVLPFNPMPMGLTGAIGGATCSGPMVDKHNSKYDKYRDWGVDKQTLKEINEIAKQNEFSMIINDKIYKDGHWDHLCNEISEIKKPRSKKRTAKW